MFSRSKFYSLNTFWVVIGFAISAAQPAFAASVGTDRGVPISRQILTSSWSIASDGRIYSGDVIYYPEALIKSGVVANLWPRGILYYEIGSSVTTAERAAFLKACQAWAVGTPVKCTERTNELEYVRVSTHHGERCGGANVSCSALGMVGLGIGQDIFIYPTHWTSQSLLQHEIGHAFGLIHEHQRVDRDAYVTILTKNISQGAIGQFITMKSVSSTEYDFDSIMHYDNCAFSVAQCDPRAPVEATASIIPKACNRDLVGGQAITSLDLDGLRAAYLPSVYGLYPKRRKAACGFHDLSPEQVLRACPSGNCQASQVTYNKREDFHHEVCSGGFVTDPAHFETCPVLKTLLGSSSNSSSFACGTGDPRTKYYWDWSCACAKQELFKLCIDIEAQFDSGALDKLRASPRMEDVAVLRYIDQVQAWYASKRIETDTSQYAGALFTKNYLQDEFGLRLYSLLCQMRLVIELNLYVSPNFTLKHSEFLKLVRAVGMGG